VADALRRLADALDEILGANLVGIYLYGSLTQRAFDPARSDVDILVVVRRDLSVRQFGRLEEWLAAEAIDDPWIPRLQVQFLVRGRLLREDTRGALYQFGTLRRSGSDGNPIIWLNVLASGRTLTGPRPRSLLPPITSQMLRAALVRELEYIRAEVSHPESRWSSLRFYRAYAVLTLCRILYTHQMGEIASKPRAARWALRVVPTRWHSLIHAAGGEQSDGGGSLPLPRIARFIEYVDGQLNLPGGSWQAGTRMPT
jgi:predicted nucleotidyltransferase